MLLQFAVQNFRSFHDRTELSMRSAASVVRSGPCASLSDNLEVLRCAAIYGANASGKSNLIQALLFAKELLTRGVPSKDSKIRIPRFRLATSTQEEPTRFELYIYKDGLIYGYSFSILASRIVAEKLTVSDPASPEEEEVLFERNGDEYTISERARESEPRSGFSDYVSEGTRDNQLFAQEAHERELPFIKPLYRWFADTLTIIQPDAEFLWLSAMVESNDEFRAYLQSVLGWADTGIVNVTTERQPLDKGFREEVESLLANPKTRVLVESMSPKGRNLSIIENESGDLEALSIVTRHRGEVSPVRFDASDESDGTLRLMHLAPMLYFAKEQNDIVFVVDELDRSLHTLLAKELVKRFVETLPEEGKPTTQLIFTTHDTNLLDCNVLGHDSIWFTEKDRQGASILYSLAEYQPEQLEELTNELEKGYLRGRFGGIPFIGDPAQLGWTSSAPKAGHQVAP